VAFMFAMILSMSIVVSPSESYESFSKRFFNEFSFQRLQSLNEFYHPQIEFIDPLGSHRGIESLKAYYGKMYQNVKSIRFEFADSLQKENTVVLVWTMHCSHSALNSGKEFSVEGMSHIRFDPETGKAIYHRDYFDVGEMIYENVPIVRNMVRFIKSRAASTP